MSHVILVSPSVRLYVCNAYIFVRGVVSAGASADDFSPPFKGLLDIAI